MPMRSARLHGLFHRGWIWLLALILLIAGIPAAQAGVPQFDSLGLAINYLNERQTSMVDVIEFSLANDEMAQWSDEDLKVAVWYCLPYVTTAAIHLDRTGFGAVDVRVTKITYRDSLRMLRAYEAGDLSSLSPEEKGVLNQAIGLVDTLKAQYNGLDLEAAIYNTICRNMTYASDDDTSSDLFQYRTTLYSAFAEGLGNCQAYASAFYLLGNLAGFDVGLISGWQLDNSSISHLWNTIRLSGNTYMVDVGSGDMTPQQDGHPQLFHNYYNIGQDRAAFDSWAMCQIFPTTSVNLSYYNNQPGYGGYCATLEEAANYCLAQRDAGYGVCELMIAGQVVSNDALNSALQKAGSRYRESLSWIFWSISWAGNSYIYLVWES